MHRPASVGRLFGLIFTLAIGGIIFSTHAALTDSVLKVTSLGALGNNDSVPWSQLGADSTLLLATINANSTGAIAITGTLAADGSLASVVCPASPCSWGSPGNGGFNAGDTVIWTSDTANGGTGPFKLAFGASVKGAGALIQADGPGSFTAQIQAFNGTTSLGTFTAASDPQGDAVFLGVVDNTAAHITSVVYSLTACTGPCSDFAIDTLFIQSASGGPTPTATGTGAPTATATGTGAPTATATATPTALPTTSMLGVPASITFGNVDASSSSKARKLSIMNKGTVNALVGAVSVPSGFAISPGTDLCSNQIVLPKKSCGMMLQFSPTAPGPISGLSVSVPYNGVAPVSVGLSGNGTAVSLKAPTTVVFAPVAAGSTGATKLITFTNMGKTATVQMGNTPPPGSPFNIASDTCSGMSIAPRGRCMIGLQFSAAQGAVSKSTVTGTLNVSFTYGSNQGFISPISLMGKVR
jgi:hypothetical protein